MTAGWPDDVNLAAALVLWLGAAAPLRLALAGKAGWSMPTGARPVWGRLAFSRCLAFASWTVGLVPEAGLWRM